jgi:hypothetical protein
MTKKQIEKRAGELFTEHAGYIQFNIMDVGKVLDAARQGLINGTDGVTEIKEAVEKYRFEPAAKFTAEEINEMQYLLRDFIKAEWTPEYLDAFYDRARDLLCI